MIRMLVRGLPALLAAGALAAAILLAGLLAWNPGARRAGDALVLFGFLWPFHAALLAPFAALALAGLAWGARAAQPPRPALVSATVVASSVAALLAGNALLRFHLGYSVLRSGTPLLTPLGVATLLCFASLPVGVAWAAARVGSGRRGRTVWVAGCVWGLLAAALGVANLRDEVPVQPDMAGLAARAGAPPPSPAAQFVARAPGAAIERVMLLGFDGVSWHAVDALLRQGALPNLAALIQGGARAALASDVPTTSPALWTTMATGRRPDAHGIYGFTRFRLPGVHTQLERAPTWATMNWWNGLNRLLAWAALVGFGEQVHYTQPDRRVAAVWEVARQAGRSTGVTRWYTTWPVVEQASGSFMVSDFTRRAGSLSPRQRILERFDAVSLREPVVPADSPLRRDTKLADRTRASQAQMLWSLALYREFRPDLAMHYWHYTDAIQHLAWLDERAVPLPPNVERGGSLSRAVADSYAVMDQWIGEFAAACDRGTLLLIASDHGFSFSGHEHHVAPPGILLAAGAGVRAGTVLEGAHLLDVAPTLLAALGLPLAETLEGRVLPIFADGALPPIRRVADYTWFAPTSADAAPSPEIDRDTLEQLRELGYVN